MDDGLYRWSSPFSKRTRVRPSSIRSTTVPQLWRGCLTRSPMAKTALLSRLSDRSSGSAELSSGIAAEAPHAPPTSLAFSFASLAFFLASLPDDDPLPAEPSLPADADADTLQPIDSEPLRSAKPLRRHSEGRQGESAAAKGARTCEHGR